VYPVLTGLVAPVVPAGVTLGVAVPVVGATYGLGNEGLIGETVGELAGIYGLGVAVTGTCGFGTVGFMPSGVAFLNAPSRNEA